MRFMSKIVYEVLTHPPSETLRNTWPSFVLLELASFREPVHPNSGAGCIKKKKRVI